MNPVKAWKARITPDEWVKNSYLCIALEGEHGVEGAYAALKVGGTLVGCLTAPLRFLPIHGNMSTPGETRITHIMHQSQKT
jgi:hypothetical protein